MVIQSTFPHEIRHRCLYMQGVQLRDDTPKISNSGHLRRGKLQGWRAGKRGGELMFPVHTVAILDYLPVACIIHSWKGIFKLLEDLKKQEDTSCMTSQQADRHKEIFKNKSLQLLDSTMAWTSRLRNFPEYSRHSTRVNGYHFHVFMWGGRSWKTWDIMPNATNRTEFDTSADITQTNFQKSIGNIIFWSRTWHQHDIQK